MRILGYGKYLPNNIVKNEDFEKIIDTSDEWITQRTGIKERRISEEQTSELAYKAALNAIENANIDKDEIDLIICATMTADYVTPSLACQIQRKLNLKNEVMAFDINAACSGFIYALSVAEGLLKKYKKALVIGSEVMSKIIDFQDRNTCVLFGDGAGCVVVENSDFQHHFHICSSGNEDVLVAGKSNLNYSLNNSELKSKFLYMDGREVFKFAINVMEDSIKKVLENSEKNIEDIECIIPHQANQRIISNVSKKLKLSLDKFFTNLKYYGNTSAASVAIALVEAFEQKRIKKRDKVILVGFGAGLTWASCLIEV